MRLTKLKLMATYNKRGYKPAKEKPVKEETEVNQELVEDMSVIEKNSKTAEVFSALDATASKTEDFVAKNQKIIIGFVAAVALITIGYIAYQKLVAGPKEEDAAEQMFIAQQNFQKATDGVASDSLYKLSLNGSEGKWGFVKIADEYSGTNNGNLANYYAGIAYLNIGKYDEAINYLENFKTEDVILNSLSLGAIGDSNAQKNKLDDALDYYIKAFESNKNNFTTPRFLLKAGKVALSLGKKEDALEYFTAIKENYESTPEGQTVDALIGLAQ